MLKSEVKGVWPAVIIPVDETGQPAMVELEKIIQLFLDQKLDGLYILGSTGQGFLFTEEQRIRIARRVLEITNGQIPVIVQVGALNTNESIRLAQAAQKDGAYGVSSVKPIYYSLSTDRVFDHYNAIGSSIDIPFFPYHIGNHSIFTNGDATEYVEKVLAIPNVTGMKLTTQNLYEIGLISNLSAGRLSLFSGADELFCQAAMCGTVGAIGSFFNIWGLECKKIRAAFLRGEIELCSDFMLLFQKIIYKVLPNAWSFFRQAMYLKHNIEIGLPNPPLGYRQKPWDENEVKALLNQVEAFTKRVV